MRCGMLLGAVLGLAACGKPAVARRAMALMVSRARRYTPVWLACQKHSWLRHCSNIAMAVANMR